MAQRDPGRPFCFWFGSQDPHRPYEPGTGARAGLKPESVRVSRFLPDTPEVRQDLLDYYFEVQRFDRDLGRVIELLARTGELDNTIVVVTCDNGMPFPRAKANVYDGGARVPLVIRWPGIAGAGSQVEAIGQPHGPRAHLAGGRRAEAARGDDGPQPPADSPRRIATRARPCFRRAGAPRKCQARRSQLSRAGRSGRRTILYIRNFRPDRWPAGDPELYFAVGPFGDIDGGPSKSVLLDRRQDPAIAPLFHLATAKRPPEELYDVGRDPDQVRNLAGQPQYRDVQRRLRSELDAWLRETGDPRMAGDDDRWDRFPYFGQPAK